LFYNGNLEQYLPINILLQPHCGGVFSLGACFGGNGTLIGAFANVISAGICKKSNFPIFFMTFTKYGAVITLINLAFFTVFIMCRYF